ncbi:MAG: TetR/AcrR family transcriptional regulator, partial [bacterium]
HLLYNDVKYGLLVPAPPKHSDREILDRAVRRFWVGGYGATTIRDLERALDLSAPSIYHRFADKEALFLRVVDHYVETVIEARIASYLGASADPVVDLYRFFRTAQSPNGCLLTTTAVELGPSSSLIRARVERGFDAMRAGILGDARRAHAQGATAEDPDDVSNALLVDMQGLMVLSRLGLPGDALRERTRVVFASRFGDAFRPRERRG